MDLTYFKTLNAINVNENTEKKKSGNTELTYLSWPWAVTEVSKIFPDFKYEIEFFDGLPYVYDAKTGYMVFTNVTIEGITKRMWLPVMDSKNKAMLDHPYTYETKTSKFSVDAATMFDINKTIMRCLVKNLGMFGLGLYIYAGEDLPETDFEEAVRTDPVQEAKDKLLKSKQNAMAVANAMGVDISDLLKKTGWKEGDAATQDQVDKVIVMLKELSDERSKNK